MDDRSSSPRPETSRSAQAGDTGASECPICYEIITSSEHSTIHPCEHIFYYTCINSWLDSNWARINARISQLTCPLCRIPIDHIRHAYNETRSTYDTLNLQDHFRDPFPAVPLQLSMDMGPWPRGLELALAETLEAIGAGIVNPREGQYTGNLGRLQTPEDRQEVIAEAMGSWNHTRRPLNPANEGIPQGLAPSERGPSEEQREPCDAANEQNTRGNRQEVGRNERETEQRGAQRREQFNMSIWKENMAEVQRMKARQLNLPLTDAQMESTRRIANELTDQALQAALHFTAGQEMTEIDILWGNLWKMRGLWGSPKTRHLMLS